VLPCEHIKDCAGSVRGCGLVWVCVGCLSPCGGAVQQVRGLVGCMEVACGAVHVYRAVGTFYADYVLSERCVRTATRLGMRT